MMERVWPQRADGWWVSLPRSHPTCRIQRLIGVATHSGNPGQIVGRAAGFGYTGQLIHMAQTPARFDHIRRVDVAEVAGYFGANPGGFIKKAEAARQAGDEGVGNKKRGWPG